MYFDRPINRNLWAVAAIIVCIVLIGVAAGVLAQHRADPGAHSRIRTLV